MQFCNYAHEQSHMLQSMHMTGNNHIDAFQQAINRWRDRSCTWGMILNEIHFIIPGYSKYSLQVQNSGLIHNYSFQSIICRITHA